MSRFDPSKILLSVRRIRIALRAAIDAQHDRLAVPEKGVEIPGALLVGVHHEGASHIRGVALSAHVGPVDITRDGESPKPPAGHPT